MNRLLMFGLGVAGWWLLNRSPNSSTSSAEQVPTSPAEQVRGASGTDWLVSYRTLPNYPDIKEFTVVTALPSGAVTSIVQFRQKGSDTNSRIVSEWPARAMLTQLGYGDPTIISQLEQKAVADFNIRTV